jgi:hypothetical protein
VEMSPAKPIFSPSSTKCANEVSRATVVGFCDFNKFFWFCYNFSTLSHLRIFRGFSQNFSIPATYKVTIAPQMNNAISRSVLLDQNSKKYPENDESEYQLFLLLEPILLQ